MSDAADHQLPVVAEVAFSGLVPAVVADTHERAAERFLEYFAATIRNANTRAAYMAAVADFLAFAPDRLLEHLEAYLAALGPQEAKAPLFRSARGRAGELTGERLTRFDAYAMVRRRAARADVTAKIGNHSFRGTGITTFLLNDGSLELAQEMANHASPRTTKLYDRRTDKITQDAVERIRIE